jgi:hypothetical protein
MPLLKISDNDKQVIDDDDDEEDERSVFYYVLSSKGEIEQVTALSVRLRRGLL